MPSTQTISSRSSQVIGPIDHGTWFTLRELNESAKTMRRENVNGCYTYNLELHDQAIKGMLREICA